MVKHVSVLMIVLLIVSFLSSVGFICPARASLVTLSGQWDKVWITPTTHAYCVQNNVWDPDSGWEQELQVNDQTGAFTVTKSNANAAHVVSYPSIYKGNHWGTATTDSGMPMQVSGLSVETSWNISTISSGAWNAAYDVWFHQTSDYTGGSPNGAELMIWINWLGSMQPAGSKVATVSIAGASWEVWFADWSDWDYIAYRRIINTTFASFDLNTFVTDAVSRDYIQNSWYLISVEAGFEIWQGGVGLTSNSFSVTAIQDVAVISVTPSLTQVDIGEPVNITVVVKNDGSVAETFDVTAYYNTTEIDMKSVTDLAAGANKTLTFTWDTSGVALGNYTIKAEASTVPDETNTDNNALTADDTVTVKEAVPSIPWMWITIAVVIIVIAIAAAYVLKRKKQA